MSTPKATIIYRPGDVYFEPDEGYPYCKLGFTGDRRVHLLLEPGDATYTHYAMFGAAGAGVWTALPEAAETGRYVVPVTLASVAGLVSENAGPFALADGMALSVAAFDATGRYVVETVTFRTASFTNIGAATAPEVAAAVNLQSVNVLAAAVEDQVKLTAKNARAGESFVTVMESPAADALGLGYGAGTTNYSEWRESQGKPSWRGLSASSRRVCVRFRKGASGAKSASVFDDVVLDTVCPVLPCHVRNLFGFGLPLVRGDGTAFTDKQMYELCLAGISRMEETLHLYLSPVRLAAAPERRAAENLRQRYDFDLAESPYDYRERDALAWWFLELRNYPVIGTPRIRFVFVTDMTVMEAPDLWIKVYPNVGQVHITPGGAGLANFALTTGGRYLPIGMGMYSRLPQYVWVDYTAGFRRADLPADVWEHTCKMAAISLFNIAGDAVEFGTSSRSLSDGVISQSWSATAGVENALLGARIIQYKKELEDFLKRAVGRYRRPRLAVV